MGSLSLPSLSTMPPATVLRPEMLPAAVLAQAARDERQQSVGSCLELFNALQRHFGSPVHCMHAPSPGDCLEQCLAVKLSIGSYLINIKPCA